MDIDHKSDSKHHEQAPESSQSFRKFCWFFRVNNMRIQGENEKRKRDIGEERIGDREVSSFHHFLGLQRASVNEKVGSSLFTKTAVKPLVTECQGDCWSR